MSDSSDLKTPLLLLAMPQVQDPFFQKSVVLLVHHESEEGSLGFIVNRPLQLTIAEILEDLEIRWQGDPGARAFFGGPVSSEMGTLVYRENDEIEVTSSGEGEAVAGDEDEGEERGSTVHAAGMAFSQSVSDLDLVADLQPEDYRLYFGYAGWGEGQLEEEILRNDWLIAPAREDLIFCADPDETWRHAVESVGVDPDHLPAWTPSEHGLN